MYAAWFISIFFEKSQSGVFSIGQGAQTHFKKKSSGVWDGFLPQERGFKMKISSIDFLTQIDILTMFKTWLQVVSTPSTPRLCAALPRAASGQHFALHRGFAPRGPWEQDLFYFFISFSSSSLFSFSSHHNYTSVMISSIFLDISLPFSCCCFFIHLLLFLPFPIQQSLFLFFSFVLRLFSSHSSSFVVWTSTQFSSFISFAWFKSIITMLFLCKFLHFLPLLFSFLLIFFSFSSFFLPLLFFFISHCDNFHNFPCHFLGAVLPAPALYPSLLTQALCFCRNKGGMPLFLKN